MHKFEQDTVYRVFTILVEFSDAYVASDAMQAMQRRMRTKLVPEIEAQGFDKLRSRITITFKDGKEISGWADERYRGGPENPLTDDEAEAKARSCCAVVLTDAEQDALLKKAWGVLELDDARTTLAQAMTPAA